MLFSYGLSIIPDEHKAAYNLIAAVYYGDGLSSQNLSRPAIPADTVSPTPETLATHWYGGLPVQQGWLDTFVPADAPLPGTYPLIDPDDGVTVLLTEEDAQAAWDARRIYVVTRDDELGAVATSAKELAFADLGIMARPDPEP